MNAGDRISFDSTQKDDAPFSFGMVDADFKPTNAKLASIHFDDNEPDLAQVSDRSFVAKVLGTEAKTGRYYVSRRPRSSRRRRSRVSRSRSRAQRKKPKRKHGTHARRRV